MIKVLIVEDDPMVAELNRRYLEKIEGFRLVGIVANGETALTFLKENTVELVLLDIFMPGINGLETLAAIRREQYGVDVIVVTAARDSRSVQAALRQGAVDYLIKPFDFERFQTALNGFKKRAHLIRREGDLCQADLDQQIFSQTLQSDSVLPKGVDRNTMKRVWEQICQAKGEFTAEEMANYVGISQVSMRKYLKHLQNMELLSVDISYGAVGRPVYRYRCIQVKTQF
jgi:CitB family two-component system response regulator MalR